MEFWVPVPGYGGLYEASSQGRVRSLPRITVGKLGKPRRRPLRMLWLHYDDNGYRRVTVTGKSRLLHRIVLEAFVGPCPEGMECCHNNGDRSDCRPENLRWGTHKENSQDRVAHGTSRRGESHSLAKLKEWQVLEIFASSGSLAKVAAMYGVSKHTVHDIRRGRSWGHLTSTAQDNSLSSAR